MMRTNNNGGDICHNVQIAVDDKNHLVVAVDVTSEPVDKQQLHSITSQAKEELGVDIITAIADKGYYSASEFAKCKEDSIIPIVSKADHSHMAATIEYGKSQFTFVLKGNFSEPTNPEKKMQNMQCIRDVRTNAPLMQKAERYRTGHFKGSQTR